MSDIERIQSTERMSHIVKHNRTVYLSGQTASDESWSVRRQTEECLSQIEKLLEEAGSSTDHILSAVIYLRDIKDFSEMNSVWDAWVSGRPKPARACVEARMASPEILVEISVVAAARA